jgi:hypothetical protein
MRKVDKEGAKENEQEAIIETDPPLGMHNNG